MFSSYSYRLGVDSFISQAILRTPPFSQAFNMAQQKDGWWVAILYCSGRIMGFALCKQRRFPMAC